MRDSVCHRYKEDGEIVEGFNTYEVNANSFIGIRKLFDRQKERGIHKSDFNDDKWILDDGYDTVALDFKKLKIAPVGYSLKQYIYITKLNIVDLIEAYGIDTIQDVLNRISQLEMYSNGYRKRINADVLKKSDLNIIDDLEEYLDIEIEHDDIEEINQELDGECDSNIHGVTGSTSNQRDLCHHFMSYFILDEELKDIWEYGTDEDRVVYGPLCLFSESAGVIPMRPKAFCGTPRDVVSQDNEGQYYIMLRQSGIKGTNKLKTNRFEKDNPVIARAATEKIVEMFWDYRKLVADTYFENDTRLFNNDAYNRIRGVRRERRFKRVHLAMLLNDFYERIIIPKGYTIVDNKRNTILDYEKKEIERIRLGDWRHLSFIGGIFQCKDPVTLMEIGGQDSLASTCHYITNFKNFCNTYLAYISAVKYKEKSNMRININDTEDNYVGIAKEVWGGKCNYFLLHDNEMCTRFVLNNHWGCKYFVPDRNSKASKKAQIDAEVNTIFYTLKDNLESQPLVIDKIKQLQNKLEEYRRID